MRQIGIIAHRLCWLLLLGACQCGAPTTSIVLTPDPACDPTSNPTIPNVGLLFQGGQGERVCLVLVWKREQKEARSTATAMLFPDGTLKGWDKEKQAFVAAVSLPNPKDVLADAQTNTWQVAMRLYYLRHREDPAGLQAVHDALCEKSGLTGFHCPSSSEDQCWFSMELPPTLPADNKLKLEVVTKSCKVCVPEICNNRKDDDCNGKTDGEDPECSNCRTGQTRPCASVPPNLRNIGGCKEGTQTCGDDFKWGECKGEVKNTKEICNSIDDDCNGQIDDGIKDCCDPGSVRSCYAGDAKQAGIGICKLGTELCTRNAQGGGAWTGQCIGGEDKSKPEECNGADDNCDGQIDEGLVRECYDGAANTKNVSGCKAGKQSCQSNGVWGTCQGQMLPQREVCNGKDDDCNGLIDDAIVAPGIPCTIPGALGPCAAGTLSACVAGVFVCTSSHTKTTTDQCDDGIDNNCDGNIDEGCACAKNASQSCYSGTPNTANIGACKKGTQMCVSNQWGTCQGEILPTAELCNNIDDDCDGQVDNGLVQNCYTGPSGTLGKGICKQGTQTCSVGKWGTCTGEVKPATETCNEKDDDCNGQIDEVCQCKPNEKESCYNGPPNTAGFGLCQAGQRTCDSKGQWGACLGEITPSAEICDGKDNDCNNKIDDGLTRSCYKGPAGTAGKGVCQAGTETCSKGAWSTCVGEIKPTSPDDCDGKDNDCDGTIDEDCACQTGQTQDCYNGPAGTEQRGQCRKGTQLCTAGIWGPCVGEVTPRAETCNNKDDDCDGAIDENLQRSCYSGASGTAQNPPCQQGSQSCSAGQWGTCTGEVTPTTETCNGQDDDCDGKTDNITGSSDPLTQPCYTGPTGTENIGVCKSGTQECISGTWSTTCTGQITPSDEICDGKDNDCDGKTDESITNLHCSSQGCPATYTCDPSSKDCFCQ